MWSGRTRQNKLVHFSPDLDVRVGGTADVVVTRAAPALAARRSRAGRSAARGRVRIPIPVTAAPA